MQRCEADQPFALIDNRVVDHHEHQSVVGCEQFAAGFSVDILQASEALSGKHFIAGRHVQIQPPTDGRFDFRKVAHDQIAPLFRGWLTTFGNPQ